ncbi:hypothetical protein COOONC_21236 [Cooperia oncophora]
MKEKYVFSAICPTYTAFSSWYSKFNLGLNPDLKWDPRLSREACDEARRRRTSDAPYKFKADKRFMVFASPEKMVKEVLEDASQDETKTKINTPHFLV